MTLIQNINNSPPSK